MLIETTPDTDILLTCGRDEADVFLESRVSQADPNRNALVSGESQEPVPFVSRP